MVKPTKSLPHISSFAAPTDADIDLFESLSVEDQQNLIEKGFAGEANQLTAEGYLERLKRRGAHG